MSAYKALRCGPGLWRVTDRYGGCMYLIEGGEKALLIDTGMGGQPLAPFLRTLTDKPVELALTHAHIDHMYRWAEFARVYVHETEQRAYTAATQRLMRLGAVAFGRRVQNFPVASFCPLPEGAAIDLGGLSVVCRRAGGHTPGSCLYVDDAHRAVFCGDAVGSGSGVWLFLPDCTGVRMYRDELENALCVLETRKDYIFYPGHNEPENGRFHVPVTYGTFAAMHALCGALLDGTAQPVFSLGALRYYHSGQAALLTRKKKIRQGAAP